MDCIFCKIINKQESSEILYENDRFIVIKDINPKASVHLLIIPKKHISSLKEVGQEDKELLGELILVARELAEQKGLKGYKLIINVGREGGQIVEHLHLHLLGGKPVELP